MRKMTGLSGEYVTVDQNVPKCKFVFEFLLIHLMVFMKLVVLIVHFNKQKMVSLNMLVNFLKFRSERERRKTSFANNETVKYHNNRIRGEKQ